MSTTAEALAPLSDAPASPEAAPPNGEVPPKESAADPSPAAARKPSDTTIEPETSRINDRFAELTRNWRTAERDRDHWRDLAMRGQPRETAPSPQPQPQPSTPKTLADFNFDEGRFRAYELEEVSRIASEAAGKKFRENQEAEARQRRDAQFVARARELEKEKPDFKEVAYSAPINDAVAETLKGIEQGPELAYYLGKNPEVAARLNSFPENVSAFELGMIAQRLKGEREAAAAAAKKVSEAPPPEPRIGASSESGASVSTTDPASDNLSDNEWVKRENARLKRKAQRQT